MNKILEQLKTLNSESNTKIVKFLKSNGYKAKTVDNIPCVNLDGTIYQIFANWICFTGRTEYNLQKLEIEHFNTKYQEYLRKSIKAIA